jgi:hypothetical protein
MQNDDRPRLSSTVDLLPTLRMLLKLDGTASNSVGYTDTRQRGVCRKAHRSLKGGDVNRRRALLGERTVALLRVAIKESEASGAAS